MISRSHTLASTVHNLGPARIASPGRSKLARPGFIWTVSRKTGHVECCAGIWTITALERSRPAADASLEVHVAEISLGHKESL